MDALEQIKQLEQRLLEAMRTSNVQTLEALLSDELVFVDHTGNVVGKQTDLNAHASGSIRIDSLQASEQTIRIYRDTAVVSVLLKIQGLFFGHPSEGTFRFSRVWVKEEDVWRIVAGHSTMVKG